MSEIKLLDKALASYLKVVTFQQKDVTFYYFDPGLMAESWDLISIQKKTEHIVSIQIQLMHINQEDVESNEFIAENGSPYISCNPSRYQQLISFLETIMSKQNHRTTSLFSSSSFFRSLKEDELRKIDRLKTLQRPDDIYEYIPNKEGDVPLTDKRLLMLPRWSKQYGENQVQGLWFFTVPIIRLSHAPFDFILDSSGLGTLTLYEDAFSAFIHLLRSRLFIL